MRIVTEAPRTLLDRIFDAIEEARGCGLAVLRVELTKEEAEEVANECGFIWGKNSTLFGYPVVIK